MAGDLRLASILPESCEVWFGAKLKAVRFEMRGAVHVLWPEDAILRRLTEPARASGLP